MTHADAAERARKSYAPRDHTAYLDRARAILTFQRARRDMLEALSVWVARGGSTKEAAREADATCAAMRQIVADQGVDRIARNGVSSIAETAAKAENANASRRQPEGVTLNQIGAELTRPTGIPNPVLAENLRSVNAGGMPYE